MAIGEALRSTLTPTASSLGNGRQWEWLKRTDPALEKMLSRDYRVSMVEAIEWEAFLSQATGGSKP
jgi:hypothetical protein